MPEISVHSRALAALDVLGSDEVTAVHRALRSLAARGVEGKRGAGESVLVSATPTLRVVVRRRGGVAQGIELVDVVREETLTTYRA